MRVVSYRFLYRIDFMFDNFSDTKIVKGESRDKRKLYFGVGYAETHPIFYKYSERRE